MSTGVVVEALLLSHVWSQDFVHDSTSEVQSLRCLTVVDSLERRCIAIVVRCGFTSRDATDVLNELLAAHGSLARLRREDGTEFVAKHVQAWRKEGSVRARRIVPGHPWRNGANEHSSGILRDD